MKKQTISVVVTPELLAVLHAADQALKTSRARKKPDVAPLHALIVQVAAARSRVMPVLEPSPGAVGAQ